MAYASHFKHLKVKRQNLEIQAKATVTDLVRNTDGRIEEIKTGTQEVVKIEGTPVWRHLRCCQSFYQKILGQIKKYMQQTM